MTRVLLTGMTAPQASLRANKRSWSFAGQLSEALAWGSVEVEWVEPQVSWDKDFFDQYDSVLVGVSPVTGLGASRAYGALSVIGHLYDDPKLHLFFEAPNPYQITHSLNAILKNPQSMLKEFYKGRKGYDEAQVPENRLRIYTAIRLLATTEWPDTIYPKLPWSQEDPVPQLPEGAEDHVWDINLDVFTLDSQRKKMYNGLVVQERWTTDDPKSKWLEPIENTLAYEVENLKSNRFSTDDEVDTRMATSVGVILTTSKRGKTWWSYRYAQALRLGVPIVTEWRDAELLGEEWTTLASQIEHMSDERRASLASDQLASYTRALEPKDATFKNLELFLGLQKGATWPSNE